MYLLCIYLIIIIYLYYFHYYYYCCVVFVSIMCTIGRGSAGFRQIGWMVGCWVGSLSFPLGGPLWLGCNICFVGVHDVSVCRVFCCTINVLIMYLYYHNVGSMLKGVIRYHSRRCGWLHLIYLCIYLFLIMYLLTHYLFLFFILFFIILPTHGR